MTRSRGPGPGRPQAILAAVLATVAARLLLDAAGTAGPALGLALDLVAALAAAWAASAVARQPRDLRSLRAWVTLTAFPLVWALAPVTWLLGLPDIVAHLARAGAVLLVATSWWYAARAGGTLSRVRLVVDGSIGLASAVVVGWAPLWARDWSTGGVGAAVAIGPSVAMVGVTVLGAGVVLTEMPAGRRVRPLGFVLGTLVIAVSDTAWTLDLPPVWAAGWVAYTLAIRTQPGLTPRVRRVPTRGRQVYLPYLLIAPSAASLALTSRDGPPSHVEVVAGLAIVALLLVRQHVTLVENDHLVRRLEQTEQMLRHRATHDSLTGLPGRSVLDERLAATAREHRSAPTRVALAFVDVDHFKQVNDLHGHASGDAVLIELARRLERSRDRRSGSFAARLAGDEFALLVTGPEAADGDGLAAALTGELDGPVTVGPASIDIRVSVGVAAAHLPDVLGSDLLHAADVAMYEVKRAGRTQPG